MKKDIGPGTILFLVSPIGEMPEGFYILLSRPDDVLIDLVALDECQRGRWQDEPVEPEIYYGARDEIDRFFVLPPVQAPPSRSGSRPPPPIPYHPYADIASLN